MRRFLCTLFTVLLIFGNSLTADQPPEMRGVWLAWAGNNVPTKAEITDWFNQLADANLNTVYVDVWRYGYTYYQSEFYGGLTGHSTDPALDDGRDILQEMIAEGHRHGMNVEAWFEYGFVPCHGENDDLYDVHPEWFAQRRDGSVLFGDLDYKWLSHVNADAQQFLIDLCQEVVRKYDIDGIELDRIRYPELDCGYDSATVAVYKSEHEGSPPPQNIYDSEWMQWRGDKLTEFMVNIYDSLKAVNPNVVISNAPIVYPYGFDNFCQDWPPWMEQGALDVVSPQVYRGTNSAYEQTLDSQLNLVSNTDGFYPGLTTNIYGDELPASEIISMIQSTRARNLDGHVIWYHGTVLDDLPTLKAQVYQEKVKVPYNPEGWRQPAIIVNEDSSAVEKSGGWTAYSSIPGFEGGCYYTNSDTSEWISYPMDIPSDGWYEVYAYNITHWNAAKNATYVLQGNYGPDTVMVDQSKPGLAQWYKLGDVYLTAGNDQTVVKLTNQNVDNHLLFADAVMLLNTNRVITPPVGIQDKKKSEVLPTRVTLSQNYPNPFNPTTEIQFQLPEDTNLTLSVYNVQGQLIQTLAQGRYLRGEHTVRFNGSNIPSGFYFIRLQTPQKTYTKKMVLLK